jgi:hypothetical protein
VTDEAKTAGKLSELLVKFEAPSFRTGPGGWALSLFRGEQVREHSALDVQVMIRDLVRVRPHFADHEPLVQISRHR